MRTTSQVVGNAPASGMVDYTALPLAIRTAISRELGRSD